MSKETGRTSLSIKEDDGNIIHFFDSDEQFEGEFDFYKPKPKDIAKLFNHSDMSGFPAVSIQNMIYYSKTNIDVFRGMLQKEYKASKEDIELFVHTYSKYNNYYMTKEFIKLAKKTKGEKVSDFQDFIFDTFGYRDTFTGSSVVISSISSMLNLKSNAVPLKYHKDRSKVKQDTYIQLLSMYPNSEYNYKIKDRQPNPEFN